MSREPGHHARAEAHEHTPAASVFARSAAARVTLALAISAALWVGVLWAAGA